MQRLDQGDGVAGTVEKIRVAKSDVLCPGSYLLANVGQHYFWLHKAKAPVVNRHNGAVAAKVFTAPAGLGVTNQFVLLRAGDQVSILIQRGQTRPVGGKEGLAVEGDEGRR